MALDYNSIEEAIISYFDPDGKYSGFTEGWYLNSFSTAMNIGIGYLILTVTGTAIMKSGVPAINPYPLKFIYNVSQIFICAYVSVEALLIAYRNSYSLSCNVYNQTDPAVARLMWLFYLTKIWDFWDTIFIVLNKRWRQLSFLHVYHHFSVLLICWLQLNTFYDGDSFLFVLLNGLVHTIMYTYYFICMHTKDPETGKNLPIWWKSSLTKMQMVQFVMLMTTGINAYVKDCEGHNLHVAKLCVWYTASLLWLFAVFFAASYSKKKISGSGSGSGSGKTKTKKGD